MKIRIILTLLLICCFCFATSAFGQNATMEVKIGNTYGVIIPAQKAPEWKYVWRLPHENPAISYWTPTKEDVLKAEATLYDYLKTETPKYVAPDEIGIKGYGKIWERQGSYYRQYVGIMIGNKKKIYFNCFLKWLVTDYDWKNSPSPPGAPPGAGIYQFQVSYDMTMGTFDRLQITDGGPE